MATVLGLMSAEFQDQYGITATTNANVEIDDTKTVAQLATDVLSWISNVENLTQAVLTKGYVRVVVINPPAPILGAGDIEKGSLYNFNNASDPYAQGYWVPDVNPAILNSSGLIDLSNVNVGNFITFMTTAHTVITVVTKGVRALTALKDALISFRKRRKPLTRKTKEV